jgi:putative DNA primase/helicase
LVLERWINWREEIPPGGKRPGGKLTKVPYQPNGQHASSINPTTWSFLHKVTGDKRVGCMIAAPYVGVDLDHVIDDAGVVEPWALKIIEEVGSYSEFSPNKHGIHIWFKGALPGRGRHTAHELRCTIRADFSP